MQTKEALTYGDLQSLHFFLVGQGVRSTLVRGKKIKDAFLDIEALGQQVTLRVGAGLGVGRSFQNRSERNTFFLGQCNCLHPCAGTKRWNGFLCQGAEEGRDRVAQWVLASAYLLDHHLQ